MSDTDKTLKTIRRICDNQIFTLKEIGKHAPPNVANIINDVCNSIDRTYNIYKQTIEADSPDRFLMRPVEKIKYDGNN